MKQFIDHITARLLPCYPEDEARSLAWWIAEELTGLSRSQLLCGYKGTTNFPNTQDIVERLLHFEPIQYIFGHTLWNGLDLRVTPATLIPRPETAELVERINQFTQTLPEGKTFNVLDIGTGSGCIAIALKKAHPEWQVTGIDISPEAIEIARENARRNQVEVNFQVADIFSDQMAKSLHQWYLVNDQMVNVIVSNPPPRSLSPTPILSASTAASQSYALCPFRGKAGKGAYSSRSTRRSGRSYPSCSAD